MGWALAPDEYRLVADGGASAGSSDRYGKGLHRHPSMMSCDMAHGSDGVSPMEARAVEYAYDGLVTERFADRLRTAARGTQCASYPGPNRGGVFLLNYE